MSRDILRIYSNPELARILSPRVTTARGVSRTLTEMASRYEAITEELAADLELDDAAWGQLATELEGVRFATLRAIGRIPSLTTVELPADVTFAELISIADRIETEGGNE